MARGHAPRTFQQRQAKWSAKFGVLSNPTVSGTIFNAIQTVASQNYQTNASKMATYNDTIASVLNQYGVTGPLRALYQGFGLKVARTLNRIGHGSALVNQVNGLISYYSTAFGANPAILKLIASAITGYNQTYFS